MSRPHPIVLGPDRLGRSALVADGRLVWQGLGRPPALGGPAPEHLACPEATIRPGWVNAHTHLYSGLVPFGVPMPTPWPADFVGILAELWWRLDQALDAETLRAAARVAIGEALLAGTTTVFDHHESPGMIAGSLDLLAAAADELGARAVLSYGATERNGGSDEAVAGLAECERFAESIGPSHPTLRAMVALHAGFTVSDPTIGRAVALARRLGRPLHVHVAEDKADVADALRRGYPGALARLVELGAITRGAVLAHGIHLAPDEVAQAARRQAYFVQNPRSNRGNAVGYPAGLVSARRVALGTDGYPSRMEDEVDAARDTGLAAGEPMTLAPARLRAGWRLASLHFGERFGPWRGKPLEPYAADLAAMGPRGAVHVLVGGRVVVRDGRLVGADIDTLREEARDAARRLTDKMHPQG